MSYVGFARELRYSLALCCSGNLPSPDVNAPFCGMTAAQCYAKQALGIILQDAKAVNRGQISAHAG